MNDKKDPNASNPWMKSLLIWLGVVLALVLFVSMFDTKTRTASGEGIPYSEFLQRVDDGSVKDVAIADNIISGTYTNDSTFRTQAPDDPRLIDRLIAKNVKFSAKPKEEPSFWMILLYQSLPFLLILGVAFFVIRQMQKNAGSGAMGFGKSKAKMLTEKHGKVTFDDVAGIDEAREELQEIVDFLKDPTKFARLGGKIPKGALLVGSPGTGKTLLARAIAGEAGVPFFTISGSDFVEMFVGVGASRVRDMFEQAKKNAPCIVFIDEIDAVGRHRGAGLGNGNDEREQTLNQLLVEMDGFEANEGIIIIAATNRPDVLDPALLRPGRFDRQVVVPRPDIEGREKILAVHMKKVPLAPDVDSRTIARGTPGFSGADLANLVNEAALLAARKGKRLVAMREFEEAKDKVMMGAERKSMVMTEDEKKATAYHEAGHALVSLHVPNCDPLHKVTIIPRGRALGVTWNLPERDRYSMSMKQMKARLALAFGGRIAEQLIYGKDELNTGASNDIQQATDMARAMVMEYGMSEKLGWLRYRDNQDEVFLGHSVARSQNVSEETARLIDQEIRHLIEEAEATARKVLTDNLDQLHRLAEALLEYETVTGEEAKRAIAGEDIGREDQNKGRVVPLVAGGSSIPKTRPKKPGPFGDPAPQGA
ncbi:ATP-dependent zinc metalloprotease FtsH [Sphingomonas sp. MAH-20]|uniref:ATP-dependent zinc metalloprotease FtsH n=1 Tax=Sphingomonas horti TaxID=2682842 RepID=A0A6I4J4G7_9SPHN|nr:MULTISPECIES: ATP-dependent zinc metalloprotease FtsH [Sphingomonas]MBA2919204.1 ATP-dependent metallopeptidase FtsH/Yme1/Tma family protein [Sphingomonas sp. CGMCC 1.13658]MVO79237.1 ATP-dependent zinc metalloprotease FtsH [Sphingomonas horti]